MTPLFPQVTLVVTQRERFSATRRSLESLYAHTTCPFKLVYVDGKSPLKIKRYLEEQAKEKDFYLIRRETFLAPNQARNLAFSKIDTKYVVFVDNDVVFTPGWLDQLLDCAEKTEAWLVGPLYCIGTIEERTIHMAGGLAHIQDINGSRQFFEQHRFYGESLDLRHSELRQEPTEMIEFHCFLARTEIFKKIGLLDEKFLSQCEHWDLCLAVREAGGVVYFEPKSIISYLGANLCISDLPFFCLRWSETWNTFSLKHFQKKWNLAKNDCLDNVYYWMRSHRQEAILQWIRKGIFNIILKIFNWIEQILNQTFF